MMASTRAQRIRVALKFRLRTVMALVAAFALMCTVLVPWLKRVCFPDAWNTWIVKTVTRPDGSIVRMRIRRHPDHDEVFEEVLAGPARIREADRATGSSRPGP